MDQQKQEKTPSQPAAPVEQQGGGLALDMALLWVETNRNRILAGVAAIGLAGLAYVIYTNNAQARQHDASYVLYQLEGDPADQPTAEDFHKVANETKGTPVEQHARIREAASLFSAGKHAEAQTAYESFQRDFPASPLLADASFGVAVSMETLGKDAEALVRYQEFITRFSQSPLIHRAKLAAARLQEKAGDQQGALRTYQELASQAGGGAFGQRTAWQMEAAVAASRLIQANPALVPTNPPAATMPVPAPFNVEPAPAGQ